MDAKKGLVAVLMLAIALAAVMTVGVWTGSTSIDSADFNPAMAVVGTGFVFAIVFWTARRDASGSPLGGPQPKKRLPSNLLPFWIFAAAAVAILDFSTWLRAEPLRLRDLVMAWIIISAVIARIVQYKSVSTSP